MRLVNKIDVSVKTFYLQLYMYKREHCFNQHADLVNATVYWITLLRLGTKKRIESKLEGWCQRNNLTMCC